jgi:hypothetical protein
VYIKICITHANSLFNYTNTSYKCIAVSVCKGFLKIQFNRNDLLFVVNVNGYELCIFILCVKRRES